MWGGGGGGADERFPSCIRLSVRMKLDAKTMVWSDKEHVPILLWTNVPAIQAANALYCSSFSEVLPGYLHSDVAWQFNYLPSSNWRRLHAAGQRDSDVEVGCRGGLPVRIPTSPFPILCQSVSLLLYVAHQQAESRLRHPVDVVLVVVELAYVNFEPTLLPQSRGGGLGGGGGGRCGRGSLHHCCIPVAK